MRAGTGVTKNKEDKKTLLEPSDCKVRLTFQPDMKQSSPRVLRSKFVLNPPPFLLPRPVG